MRPIDADSLSEHKFVGNKFIQIGGRANGKTLEAVNRAYQKGWNDAIEAIIDNAPTVDVGYPPYREEKCDRKKECNDYQYWHCIGCNNCKEKEEDNGE